MSFTLEEIEFFQSQAEEISAIDLPLNKSSQLSDLAVLRKQFGPHSRAVAELVSARRSGKVPGNWLVDSDSAQQATPSAVAEYRARFLACLLYTSDAADEHRDV